MRTANNNFTVENLIAKYRNFVAENCPKRESFDGVGPFVESYDNSAEEQLLISLYKTKAGNSAQSQIVDALSHYAKQYSERYASALTSEEFTFLCEHLSEVCNVCLIYLRNNRFNRYSSITQEEIELIKKYINIDRSYTIFIADDNCSDIALHFPECVIKGCKPSNKEQWAINQIRLFSLGISSKTYYDNNDNLEKDYLKDVDYFIWTSNSDSFSFDKVRKVLQLLNPTAKMLLFLNKNDAAGKDGTSYELRKTLVKSCYVKSLISYEEKIEGMDYFNTKKIFIFADKSGCKSVQIINLLNGFSKDVNSDILDYEILWPGYYDAEKPENSIPLSELVELKDLQLIEDSKIGNFENAKWSLLDKEKSMPVITYLDMTEDYKDSNIYPEKLRLVGDPYFDDFIGFLRTITTPCVLLSGMHEKYVLGYVRELPTSGICTPYHNKCLIPKNGTDIRYLAALLLSSNIKKQIVAVCDWDVSGSITPTILEKIFVPNYSEKERFAFFAEVNYEALELLYKEKNKELEEYKKGIELKKRTLTQSLKAIDPLYYALNACRNRKNGNLVDSDIIYQDYNVKKAFESLSEEINEMKRRLKHFEVEEYSFSKPEEINPMEFIDSYIEKENIGMSNFQIIRTWTSEPQNVIQRLHKTTFRFPKDALEKIFNNILDNIKTHAFIEKDKEDYQLEFSFHADEFKLTIEIANNGSPFSDDINIPSLLKYGVSTILNKDGHSCSGCGEIVDIMNRYDGKVDIIPMYGKKYTVKYILDFYKLIMAN